MNTEFSRFGTCYKPFRFIFLLYNVVKQNVRERIGVKMACSLKQNAIDYNFRLSHTMSQFATVILKFTNIFCVTLIKLKICCERAFCDIFPLFTLYKLHVYAYIIIFIWLQRVYSPPFSFLYEYVAQYVWTGARKLCHPVSKCVFQNLS